MVRELQNFIKAYFCHFVSHTRLIQLRSSYTCIDIKWAAYVFRKLIAIHYVIKWFRDSQHNSNKCLKIILVTSLCYLLFLRY